jgi:hypothetical protein
VSDRDPRIFSPHERERKADEANGVQVGGNHYKLKKIEPWDYIVANGIGFLDGNAIKYLTRWRNKGGVEDLKKAIHYIEKLIEVETQWHDKEGGNASARQGTVDDPG